MKLISDKFIRVGLFNMSESEKNNKNDDKIEFEIKKISKRKDNKAKSSTSIALGILRTIISLSSVITSYNLLSNISQFNNIDKTFAIPYSCITIVSSAYIMFERPIKNYKNDIENFEIKKVNKTKSRKANLVTKISKNLLNLLLSVSYYFTGFSVVNPKVNVLDNIPEPFKTVSVIAALITVLESMVYLGEVVRKTSAYNEEERGIQK